MRQQRVCGSVGSRPRAVLPDARPRAEVGRLLLLVLRGVRGESGRSGQVGDGRRHDRVPVPLQGGAGVSGKKRGATAPRPRSGWVSEDDRKTERLTLRLPPEAMDRLRTYAVEHGWTVSETVAKALEALEREVEAD